VARLTDTLNRLMTSLRLPDVDEEAGKAEAMRAAQARWRRRGFAAGG
jgi:hypothetical protein